MRASTLSLATCTLMVWMVSLPSPARAQAARAVVPIGPPNATLKEEFTRLLSVRELASGRVLLTDDQDSRIIAADFRTDAVRTLGRAGDGPGEYRTVGRLWDIGGDSTFMSVPYRSRWILLHRDSIVSTLTGQVPIVLKAGGGVVRGADARGAVLTLAPTVYVPGTRYTAPDSFTYVRINRATLKLDSVLKVANTDKDIKVYPRSTGAPPPPDKRMYSISLKARDQIAVFPDGVVAILRGNPYRVDWCLAPGKPCTIGALQERESRAWGDADKSAYLKAMNALAAWPPTTNVDQTFGWPEKMPPFATPGGPDEANFWPTTSGNVVVERLPNASSALFSYDVIDSHSRLVAKFSVPPGHRILGFGAKSAYVIHVDDDQVQRLQRHSWSY